MLTGIVINRLGQGINGAVVKSNDNVTSTLTHNNGIYEMWPPSGTHTITVNATGYGPQSKSVIIEAGGDANWDFVLFSNIDSDNDGLMDDIEAMLGTNPSDSDTDDDGLFDGIEDSNHNGIVDAGETDPCDPDTDDDGIQDGTELGYTLLDIGNDTDTVIFIEDADPLTTTDPLNNDTDFDMFMDGKEDKNHNGMVDEGETDPNDRSSHPPRALPWLQLLLGDD